MRSASRRIGRLYRLGIGLLAATWLCGAASNPAAAAGYWSCAAGAWSKVGEPEHPMPVKACGAPRPSASTAEACAALGGRWAPAGLSRRPLCRIPTRDAGRICADAGECEGSCLAALTPEQRDLLRKHVALLLLGKCTPSWPVFGCMAIVRAGAVTGLMCLD